MCEAFPGVWNLSTKKPVKKLGSKTMMAPDYGEPPKALCVGAATHSLAYLIFTVTLGVRGYYSYFADKETEAPRA